MNNTFAASTTSICHNGNVVSEFAAKLAFYIPTAIWIGVSLIGFYKNEILILWVSITYYPLYFAHLLLWEIMGRLPKPNPYCNDGKGMPASEPMFAFFFILFVTGINILRRRTMSWSWKLAMVFVSLFVPISLAITGNYTFSQTIVGSVIGSILGLLWAVGTHVFWAPWFDEITHIGPFRWMRYKSEIYQSSRETIDALSKKDFPLSSVRLEL